MPSLGSLHKWLLQNDVAACLRKELMVDLTKRGHYRIIHVKHVLGNLWHQF